MKKWTTEMEDLTTIQELSHAVINSDSRRVREMLTDQPELCNEEGLLHELLGAAAAQNDVKMVTLLAEFGAEIVGKNDPPEGVLFYTACNGAVEVLRWFLDNGQRLNHQMDGTKLSGLLSGAAVEGRLAVIKLLVERGADVNFVYGSGHNPLSVAIMYGQKEVEAYLRSQGAVEPAILNEEKTTGPAEMLLLHIQRHVGNPKPLALQEIVPSDFAVNIHVIDQKDKTTLVTTGMSARPMNVPEGAEVIRFAELAIHLPLNWPLSNDELNDPNNYWPIEWLRRIAHYPHENNTWLGGVNAVFPNGEPPNPLAPNTKLTCILAATDDSDFGWLLRPDGEYVAFYSLYPLYTEEWNLYKKYGSKILFQLLDANNVGPVVDINRINVADTVSNSEDENGR